MFFQTPPVKVIDRSDAIPGRDTPVEVAKTHAVLGTPTTPPWPDGYQEMAVGLGCFWGAERLFWKLEGVHSTQVGYAGGFTKNPTYKEVCSGQTGHAEVIRIVFDPTIVTIESILQVMFDNHDPTQGMRQGNDVGTQYRSIILADPTLLPRCKKALEKAREAFRREGHTLTTEIGPLETFYYAEDYHQQYLHKNPGGYCGLKGTGVNCQLG